MAAVICTLLVLYLVLGGVCVASILRADARRNAWRAQAEALGLDREWRRIIRGRE